MVYLLNGSNCMGHIYQWDMAHRNSCNIDILLLPALGWSHRIVRDRSRQNMQKNGANIL